MAKKIYSLPVEFARTFEETFQRDGVDLLGNTINGINSESLSVQPVISDLPKAMKYGYQTRTAPIQLLTFFGIPNRVTRPIEKHLTVLQVVKNLFGWHDEDSPLYQKVLNYTVVKPVLMFAFNIVTIVAKTAFNVLKLATEFVPSLISRLAEIGAEKLAVIRNNTQSSTGAKVAATIGFSFLKDVQYLFKGIHLLGRAITSPVNSIRAGLAYGDKYYTDREEGIIANLKLGKLSEEQLEDELNRAKRNSRIIKGTLVVLSGVTTAVFYTVLFPLGLKILALKAPAAVATASEVMGKALNVLSNTPYVLNVVNGILTAAKSVLTPILNTVGLEVTPAIMTAASVTLAGVTIASVAENVRKRIANVWYGAKEKASTGININNPKTSKEAISPMSSSKNIAITVNRNSEAIDIDNKELEQSTAEGRGILASIKRNVGQFIANSLRFSKKEAQTPTLPGATLKIR